MPCTQKTTLNNLIAMGLSTDIVFRPPQDFIHDLLLPLPKRRIEHHRFSSGNNLPPLPRRLPVWRQNRLVTYQLRPPIQQTETRAHILHSRPARHISILHILFLYTHNPLR